LYDVIEKIEMPKDDRLLYNKLIKDKYAKDYCFLGYKYNNKEIFDRGYSYVVSNNVDISKEILTQKKSFENLIFRYYIRFYNGIIYRLTNMMR
jgi:hypothetical protein